MTKAKLAGEVLRYMQKAYKDDDRELFSLDEIAEAFPDSERKELSRALYALQGVGIVHVFPLDDEAYSAAYNPDGIQKLIVEKGAGAVKDVIGWVIGFLQ